MPMLSLILASQLATHHNLRHYQRLMAGLREAIAGGKLEDFAAARHYLRRIEELTGIPVSLVSVGPERSQIVRAE